MDSVKQKHFGKVLGWLIFLTFDLMILGAGVRAMDAGLTCPDWPLCFGRVVPAFHLGVYFEFIHRAIAGIVALIFLYLLVITFRNKELGKVRFSMVIAGLLLLSQIIMGGLTVLNLLAFWTVTTHLALATAFLAVLIYIRFKLSQPVKVQEKRPIVPQVWLLRGIHISLGLVGAQMVLGGLVASTYSGMICVDFPTCNGQLIPTLIGPMGLQVWHRLGAFALVGALSTLFFATRYYFQKGLVEFGQYSNARRAFFLIYGQFIVGILNLAWHLPAWLTVLHSAFAILIFVSLLQCLLIANRQLKTQLLFINAS